MRAVAYALFVFLPIGLLLVHSYPAWSWMYMFDTFDASPLQVYGPVIVAYPAAGIGGYLVAERLLRSGRPALALLLPLLAFCGVVLVVVLGWERVVAVGSYREWELGVARSAPHHGRFLWDMVLVTGTSAVAFVVLLRANARKRG